MKQAAPFIFDWRRPRWDFRLPGLLLLSLLGHLVGFYLFQVVYPSATVLLPTAASVAVLNPGREPDQKVLAWADLADPGALTRPGFRPELVSRLVPKYQPSFADARPEFAPIVPESTDRLPPVFGPEGLLHTDKPPVQPEMLSFPSRVELDDALRSRPSVDAPPLPPNREYLEPTVLWVGVSEAGKVAFCFPWRSSGRSEADRRADDYVRALRFRPANAFTWGKVRVVWGYDPF
ncbi:MAG TPA: hypothetical protein VGD78_03045 [Chthoniobacterales bacterium]